MDESSPEKAIQVLGKPKTDKLNQPFRPLKFNEWFDVAKKDFRIFHYEDASAIEGFKDVKLTFRNDKLVSITLEPKELGANALSRSYEAEFVYLSDKIAQSFDPQDFERNQGKVYPKSFPTVYFLMLRAEPSYVFAMVANNSFGAILGKSMGVQDASESLPGKVAMIQLISRNLEETKSKDLLK
ncbi:MAG: hypothetical protein M3Q99_10045 [Acidobacteriota bacterium]|nr:hypothetical protein [Acidobacteriota bacterium]